MATNGNINHGGSDHFTPPSTDTPSTGSSNNNLSKDEVGWYFVEQFYTTLSKSPEKLHLFYGKRSQFVNGLEAEVANVSVGRQAIQERIKALDFQDCKVRISNVDSQASLENIVIQVIGETSNKAGSPKKFVQTFILAQQPSGYFVLNDILRYINEDGDEDVEVIPAEQEGEDEQFPSHEPEGDAAEALANPESATSKSVDPVQEEESSAHLDTSVVDKKLEQVGATAKTTASETATDTPAEPASELDATQPKQDTLDPAKAVQELAEEDARKPEAPQDPSPTPVPARDASVAAEPEKPKEPPKPMTWASRAAAAAGPPRPVVPIPKTATPPAAGHIRPPAPTNAPTPTTTSNAAAAPAQTAKVSPPASIAKDQDNDWQPARADTKRQNRPQSISRAPAEKETAMAYIKYVTEAVKEEDLRSALANFGELAYFDINRQKNCAFVEFATQAGYNAAVAANPHTVNGESIVVEQRRPKANAYGGSNYNATRGGTAGRGRGAFDGNRSNSQGGPRGGYTGQARGRGGGAPRGRGASQATNA